MAPKQILILALMIVSFLVQCKRSEKQFDFQKTQSVGQSNPEEPWRFSPEFALDNKINTSFCSQAKEIGSGFTLFLDSHSQFSAFQIWNGNYRSALDFKTNDSVKKIRISSYSVELVDIRSKMTLNDSLDIELERGKFQNKPTPKTKDIEWVLEGNVFRFEILETHGLGNTGRVCISELKFGEIKNEAFVPYPWLSFDKIRHTIENFSKAEKHYFGFQKLILANEKASIPFYEKGVILPVFFKKDKTFSFAEMYGDGDVSNFYPAMFGTYTILASTEDGLELNLSFYDSQGIERNHSWTFKRAEEGDEDYDDFKTKLGVKFSEVFNPKTHFLFVLKERETGRTFYHYELPRSK
ncbi:hypothetical protein P3G55_18280 [Leptospira sp. 96542]|nr:hypothetical protein [Leptospira sp. 96542]